MSCPFWKFEGTSKAVKLGWPGTWLEGRRGPTGTAKLGMINSQQRRNAERAAGVAVGW